MKGPQVDQLVYDCMFPKPKAQDPQNFQGLLQRQLVPEVRLETQAFYGHLSSQEAKYPGLDYSFQPHRVRLSRYQWHRRLFRAFDNLGLTNAEIASLTKWEGTLWAKERYQREQNIIIRDTTGDGIHDWVPPDIRIPVPQAQRAELVDEMDDVQATSEMDDNDPDNEMDEDEDDSDVEITSVGVELNERLRAAVAQREAGNDDTVIDEEWEQWLKDAVEAGGIPFPTSDLSPNAMIPGTRPATATDSPPMHPRLLNAARLGQWQNIPDFLHNIVRQNMAANNRRLEDQSPSSSLRQTPASNTPLSQFLSRPSLSPRPRAVPPTSSFSRPERGQFSEVFSRRPIPPPPTRTMPAGSVARRASTSRFSMNRGRGSGPAAGA